MTSKLWLITIMALWAFMAHNEGSKVGPVYTPAGKQHTETCGYYTNAQLHDKTPAVPSPPATTYHLDVTQDMDLPKKMWHFNWHKGARTMRSLLFILIMICPRSDLQAQPLSLATNNCAAISYNRCDTCSYQGTIQTTQVQHYDNCAIFNKTDQNCRQSSQIFGIIHLPVFNQSPGARTPNSPTAESWDISI